MTPPSQRWQAIARHGKNDWWRYGLGIALFLTFVVALGSIAAVLFAAVVLAIQGVSAAAFGEALSHFFQTASVAGFVGNNIPFLFGIVGLALALRLCHNRAFFSLFGADQRLQWHNLGAAFGLWFAIVSVATAMFYLLDPSDFDFTFKLGRWLPLLLVTIPLTFLQVTCEELFFRGYLLQGLGLIIRSKVVLAVLVALPFGLVHFANPEMQRGVGWMALYYFGFGLLTNWITLQSDRLEPALGFHLANNYFGILIVSSSDSVLPVPALFTVEADGSAMISVLLFITEATLFYAILQQKLPWQHEPDSNA